MQTMVALMVEFRRDIQGLRAVAVAAVVSYHMGWGPSGGFLGVDLFLVISGYVVGGILFRELIDAGTINWRRFLFRRFMRLMPALSTVILFTIFIQFLILTHPSVKRVTGETALAALSGWANFQIALEAGDYFGVEASRNPLLHTWSLSVEWQLYLALLLLFLIVGGLFPRLSRKPLVAVTAAVITISLCVTALGWQIGAFDLGGFFSPISRAWEFFLGVAAIFFSRPKEKSRPTASFLSLLGVILIGVAFLSGNSNTATPGVFSLITVVGTVLLLAAQDSEWNPIRAVLSSKTMVLLGNWSYSIYLWHWPVIVIAAQFGLTAQTSILTSLLLLAIVFVLSWWSYVFVETRFRTTRHKEPWRKLATPAILFSAPLILVASWNAGGQDRWLGLMEEKAGVVILEGDTGHHEFHQTVSEGYLPCEPDFLRESSLRWEGFLRCQQTVSSNSHDMVLLGDSHAEHLFFGLAPRFPEKNLVYFIDGHLPIDGESTRLDEVLDYVVHSSTIETVVISAYWELRGVPIEGLRQVIDRFTRSGKKVFLTDDVPTSRLDPDYCKYPPSIFQRNNFGACSSSSPADRNRQNVVESLDRLSSLTGSEIIYTYELFCDDRENCSIVSPTSEEIFYRDKNHLNLLGSQFVAEEIADEILDRQG